jgi:hypothetical protein
LSSCAAIAYGHTQRADLGTVGVCVDKKMAEGTPSPLRSVSKLFPAVGDASSGSLPKVEEDEDDDMVTTNKLFDNVRGTILDSECSISQVRASESAAVEELALKSFELTDAKEKILEEKRKHEKSGAEIMELKSIISTMELSIEKHVITSANLYIENKALKAEVRKT